MTELTLVIPLCALGVSLALLSIRFAVSEATTALMDKLDHIQTRLAQIASR